MAYYAYINIYIKLLSGVYIEADIVLNVYLHHRLYTIL